MRTNTLTGTSNSPADYPPNVIRCQHCKKTFPRMATNRKCPYCKKDHGNIQAR